MKWLPWFLMWLFVALWMSALGRVLQLVLLNITTALSLIRKYNNYRWLSFQWVNLIGGIHELLRCSKMCQGCPHWMFYLISSRRWFTRQGQIPLCTLLSTGVEMDEVKRSRFVVCKLNFQLFIWQHKPEFILKFVVIRPDTKGFFTFRSVHCIGCEINDLDVGVHRQGVEQSGQGARNAD